MKGGGGRDGLAVAAVVLHTRSPLLTLDICAIYQVGGQPGRVNRIKMVRKSIARVLTVKTAKKRGEQFKKVAKDKRKPLDARSNRFWAPSFESTHPSARSLHGVLKAVDVTCTA